MKGETLRGRAGRLRQASEAADVVEELPVTTWSSWPFLSGLALLHSWRPGWRSMFHLP